MKTDAGFGKRGLAQNSDEIGAMHVEIRRTPALFGIGKRQTCERRAVAGAANVNGVRREAGLGEFWQDAKIAQNAARIWRKLQAGADIFGAVAPFDERDTPAAARQSDCGRQAADSGSGD